MKRDVIRNTVRWHHAHKRMVFYIERLLEWFAVGPFVEKEVSEGWHIGVVRLHAGCTSKAQELFLGYFEQALRTSAGEMEKIGVKWKETGIEEVTEYLREVVKASTDSYLKVSLDVSAGASNVKDAAEKGRETLQALLLRPETLCDYIDRNDHRV